eukprot:CAMPEP_0172378284 /NCGR_PEP_ID=MMETSP1060-20121228/69343_1 /TAXON_ID=37318 /ORGANISM="Pseudo-nitzschia pungens, Strain cf. cingulata" /LENGTH=1243 /DNA_ID=CAMNT_0013106001 /DNA_START=86 /DNA_END=3817 /DNA_ORIENTATION=-
MSATVAMDELRQVLATPQPGAAPNANPNAIAHAALQALRDEGDSRFLFLRTIIEIGGLIAQQSQLQSQRILAQQNEELLFHCITGMRHVVLRKWKGFYGPFRRLVRDYFMALGSCHNNTDTTAPIFSRTIRLALFNASTSFWKRLWNEESSDGTNTQTISPAEQTLMESIHTQHQQCQNLSSLRLQIPELKGKEDLFRFLDAAMTTPGLEMASSAGFLNILIGEFAGKSASQYNMPLEFHKRCHAAFETEGWLDRSLQVSMKALSEIVGMLNSSTTIEKAKEDLALAVVQLTIDVIGWEFGIDAWDSGGFPAIKGSALVKPPVAWRSVLVQPEFVKAIFLVHSRVTHNNSGQQSSSPELSHSIRQLILLLASLFGPIFPTSDDQKTFASFLLEGILHLLTSSTKTVAEQNEESSELLDTLSMISRLIVNYKLTILVQLPLLQSLLQSMADLGRYLLQENLKECQSVQGDMESMEHREWRDEALELLVEGIVLLCSDPWLLFSGSEESRKAAQAALATTLGPLYIEFVTCRTKMAYLEETYLMANETDLDEVREEIYAVDLEEEMTSLAAVGRLDLQASLSCLSAFFGEMIPQLQALWDSSATNAVSPEAAGILEQSRLMTLYIGHLLTDENEGETRVIPDAILSACQDNQTACDAVVSAVQLLQQFAEYQVSKITSNPNDHRLSPLLAKSFLWFFNRWAPAYILPERYGSSTTPSTISLAWSNTEHVQQVISFLITLCLHYNCYWSQEGQVQENAALMLLSMAKKGSSMRLAIVSCPQFRQLVIYHCLTCGIRHSAPREEFETTMRNKAGNVQNLNLDMNMLRGFHRLPYETKGKLLTGILMACGEKDDDTSASLVNDCFTATHDAFSSLVNVLSTKQMKADNMDAKEMACVCISLYDGIALAGDMKGSERIPTFITPSLSHLSGLMEFYADDLSICEGLLRLFRDYSYQFISSLDSASCIALFQASSNLLKSYSANHCSSNRVIVNTGGTSEEEEQKYSDVLCAIELLVQLGSKDFFYTDEQSIDSSQVSEMIFVGLQQILPLMTRGLLQYPTLCSQFLQLVGFMLESYASQLKTLPYELFDALLESLLYGMTYHDASIAKSSLQGIAGIAKEHLSSRVLNVHIAATPPNSEGLIDKCARRLLTEVIFQNFIWDRLEAAGMALLPLAAIDINGFGRVVHGIAKQVPPENQQRLISNFEMLIQADIIAKIKTSKGHEGRKNRILFKKNFELFCHEIHSFMLKK